jgi:type I restriction enzyme S subunit
MDITFLHLSDVAEVISGQSPLSSSYNKLGDGYPFYQGKTDFGLTNPIPKKWCSQPKKLAENKDILMSVRAPVGPVNIAIEKSAIGRGLAAIRMKDGNDYKYLYYFLKNNQILINKYSTGSTFKAISKKDIEQLNIPIPKSLTNQRRIGKVLTDCENLIVKRKESIYFLDDFLKFTFLEMFGDPRTNSKKWEINPVKLYTDCIVPGRDKPKSFTGDIPWVKTNDLNHLNFTSKSKGDIGLTMLEIDTVRAKIIPKDSVLMTCVGDLGVVSIASNEMIVNQQLHTFQCKNELNNIFLMYSLSFQKSMMYKFASKTTVPYLNKTNCNNIPTIKPPIKLQLKFSEIVEKTQKIKSNYQSSLQELENLYDSISQRAFKGELDLTNLEKIEIEQYHVGVNDNTKPSDFVNKEKLILKKESSKKKKFKTKEEVIGNKVHKTISVTKKIKEIEYDSKLPLTDIDPATTKIKTKSKLIWKDVSVEKMANLIIEKYKDFHFNIEMLRRFFVEEKVIFPNYFSSKELKEKPHLHNQEDLKKFIFSSIVDEKGKCENPYLKLRQEFYNADKENLDLKITPEDYDTLLKGKAKESRTGIYFSIINEN